MISITGTYQHGTVVLDEPVNLPDGAHVRVTLDDPKIAAYLAEMDATPGLDMSDEEYAQWEAERRENEEWQKSQFP